MNQPIKELSAYQRCVSFCTAESYDLLSISIFFKKKGFLTRLSRDALHVSHVKRTGDIFFFNHGCIVSWGLKKSVEDKLLEQVKTYATHVMPTIEIDYFYYQYGKESSIIVHEKSRVDIINLESDDVQLKLAISYGLAQSIKLEAFEEEIKDAIKKNAYLPEEIASRGTISLSRRAIFKRIGEIFLVRSSINLNLEYLDVPEFFWRSPNLEPYYMMSQKFLDIPGRVTALNQKLDVLQELLDILNSQLQHRYSSFLESIIILLIAIEILISLFQFHIV